ncbi:MAG: 16S rRNA (uracil(1498)-N(3))-methyltransferase [Mariprofundaceae bacterium]
MFILRPNPPMSHCRIYIDQELQSDDHITIPDDQAHYLRQVMRLGAGDIITLFNGKGGEFEVEITQLSKRDSVGLIGAYSDVNRELPCRVHIVQTANRSEKIETVLQKATELGAASFQITNSERSTLKLTGSKLNSRVIRWQKIILEAAEQSGRTAIPTITWQKSLQDIDVIGDAYTLHPEAAQPWSDVRQHIIQQSDITFAIGPEGGWSRQDMDKLCQQSFQPLLFGPRVMRTETASPAILAAIQGILD